MDEAERCNRVAVLHRGELLAFDSPERLQSALGRQVLVIRADDLEQLQRDLRAFSGNEGRIAGNALRLTLTEPISLDPLLDRFRDRISALTLSHPSLDDVFVHYTGEHLNSRQGKVLVTGMVVLAWRELLHFFRQPLRLLGSLAQPLMLWLLMGSGFSESFRPASDDLNYSEFFYPGIVLMLLLFAGIFSTITLIEDRSAGFLQGVMVAPVSSLSLVLGKLVGGSAIALIQSIIFLLLAPLAGFDLSLDMVLHLVLLFALVGLGFTGFGFIVAWTMETVAGYHAVMSVVMIPLWLLSGALFPLESSSAWLRLVMLFNPITYTMQTIRGAFLRAALRPLQQSRFSLRPGGHRNVDPDLHRGGGGDRGEKGAGLILQVIEHDVDDHPAAGDEHPHGPDPAGQTLVLVECFPPGVPDGREDEGAHDRGQDDVRNEDGEVDRASPVVAGIGDGSDRVVIGEIGIQEERREGQCGHHAAPVANEIVPADAQVAQDQKEGRKEVQAGVQGR